MLSTVTIDVIIHTRYKYVNSHYLVVMGFFYTYAYVLRRVISKSLSIIYTNHSHCVPYYICMFLIKLCIFLIWQVRRPSAIVYEKCEYH